MRSLSGQPRSTVGSPCDICPGVWGRCPVKMVYHCDITTLLCVLSCRQLPDEWCVLCDSWGGVKAVRVCVVCGPARRLPTLSKLSNLDQVRARPARRQTQSMRLIGWLGLMIFPASNSGGDNRQTPTQRGKEIFYKNKSSTLRGFEVNLPNSCGAFLTKLFNLFPRLSHDLHLSGTEVKSFCQIRNTNIWNPNLVLFS